MIETCSSTVWDMKESNLKRSGKRAARIEEEEKNSSIFSDLIYSFCNGSRRNSLDTNRKEKKNNLCVFIFLLLAYIILFGFFVGGGGELWLAICRVILFEMTSMHYPECRRTCSKGIGMLLCVHLLGNLTAGCSVVYRLEHEIPAHFFPPLGNSTILYWHCGRWNLCFVVLLRLSFFVVVRVRQCQSPLVKGLLIYVGAFSGCLSRLKDSTEHSWNEIHLTILKVGL